MDAKDMVRRIEDLEYDIKILRSKLHTVEQLRVKETPMVPMIALGITICFMCHSEVKEIYKYCPDCGHRIDWRKREWQM